MRWRTINTWPWKALKTAGWLVGASVMMAAASPAAAAIPVSPMWVALAITGAFAATVRRVSGRLRRASQAARLVIGFLVLPAPGIALHPWILAFAPDTKERLIASEYGPQAASQRGDLEQRVRSTLADIDALPALPQFVGGHVDTPTTDRAFLVWSQTELAIHRLTSAVELFNADGRLISRF